MQNRIGVAWGNWIKRLQEPWEAYKAALANGDQVALKKAEKQIDALMSEYDETKVMRNN